MRADLPLHYTRYLPIPDPILFSFRKGMQNGRCTAEASPNPHYGEATENGNTTHPVPSRDSGFNTVQSPINS